MGRARRQLDVIVIKSGFDAIVGTRRGSAAAQAQRDIAEVRERERPFNEFIAAMGSFSAHAVVATALVSCYRTGEPDAAALEELLLTRVFAHGVRESMLAITYGDPPECPELTAPAIRALARYFSLSAAERYNYEVGSGTPIHSHELGTVMDDCFQPLATEEYYLRLQPLFEGLAQSITRQPKDKGHEEVATCAVGHLQEMSAATLAGPLRSWVLAFATRLQRGTASAQEREALKEMVVRTWWSGTSAAPAFEAALAPVTEALAAG